MAKPYRRKDSAYWWISPTIDGVQVDQSSKTTDYQEAVDMLRRLEGRIADGLVTVQTHKVTIAELCDLHLRDMRQNSRRSIADEVRRVETHIKPALGDVPTSSFNGDTRSNNIERRQQQGAENATINRELAAIKRAYNLGQENNVVTVVPKIKMLPEDNVRQGFFREDHFRAVLKHAN